MTQTSRITLDEFLRQPETKPASEYINGRVIQKPTPTAKHSVIQGELTAKIHTTLKSKRIARAFLELQCVFDDRAIVPDIAVFTEARIPRDVNGEISNEFSIAPDWIIEVLSQSHNQTVTIKKVLHCLQHGAQLGWIIDIDESVILVYTPQVHYLFDLDEPAQQMPVPEFAKDLRLSIGQVFQWLKE